MPDLHTEGMAENARRDPSPTVSNEIQCLIGKNTNANTAKSTKKTGSPSMPSGQQIYNQVQTDDIIADIPEDKLYNILQRFYVEIRKNNDDSYEPESLKVMQAALDRYLRENAASLAY